MLPPALRGHGRDGPFENLEQTLLDALTGNVACNRRIFRFAADLVDLVDVDDAALGALDVPVGSLKQFEKNVFDVLTHVAGFRERGGISHRKRYVQELCEGLREVGFSAARGPHDEHVRFCDLDFVDVGADARILRFARDHTLVVVVHRDGKGALRGLLTNDVGLEEVEDFIGLRELELLGLLFLLLRGLGFLSDDLVAQLDAFLANVHVRAGDEPLNLFLRLAAERALIDLARITNLCHGGEILPGKLSGLCHTSGRDAWKRGGAPATVCRCGAPPRPVHECAALTGRAAPARCGAGAPGR